MDKLIAWFNNNQGFITGLFAFFSFTMAILAIIISIKSNRTQLRIERTNIALSLLEKRIEIYDYFLDVIYNIEDEILRISSLYRDFKKREDLKFICLEKLDIPGLSVYDFTAEYKMNLRIAKSIFGNDFEEVIKEYTDYAVDYAKTKTKWENYIERHNMGNFNKWISQFSTGQDQHKAMSEKDIELLANMPKLSAIAESYTPFFIEHKFENYIEQHLDIQFI